VQPMAMRWRLCPSPLSVGIPVRRRLCPNDCAGGYAQMTAPEAMLKSLGRAKTVFEHGEGGCTTNACVPEAMPNSPGSGKMAFSSSV
jgi:hypothetical protein